MQQINLHQKKLFALIEAGLAFIALLLSWTIENNYVTGQTSSQNGFHSWGFLTLLGVLGVIAACLMGDKTKDFDKNGKLIALISFAAIALGALIYFFLLGSAEKDQNRLLQQQLQQMGYQVQSGPGGYSAKAGSGLWMALVAGVIGMAWVAGILDKINAATKAKSAVAAATTPAAPPPPPTNTAPPSNPTT